MTRTWIAAAMLLMASGAVAQEGISKIVEAKHLSGERADRAASAIVTLIGPQKIVAQYAHGLNIFVLRGSTESVEMAEKVIARLDRPPQASGSLDPVMQIYVNMYVVEASQDAVKGEAVPAVIESAVAQIRSAFAHKSYRLVDTVLLTARNGSEVSTSGGWQFPGLPEGTSARYDVRAEVSSGPGGLVFLNKLRLGVKTPNRSNTHFNDTNLGTDVTIRPNQKLVIGKLSIGDPQSSLFLILTARAE